MSHSAAKIKVKLKEQNAWEKNIKRRVVKQMCNDTL